ncbi:tRNA-dihydrouridine synthase [Escherichia coli]
MVDQLLPVKVFHRICPELQNASRTPSGTLVRAVVRSVPTMAGRERRPCGELSSWASISIAAARRKRLTVAVAGDVTKKILNSSTRGTKRCVKLYRHITISVKVRLGWTAVRRNLKSPMRFNRLALRSWWCIGGRKSRVTARSIFDWQAIGDIRQRLNIPVIANGEIWSWQSAQQIMAISGCDAVMIGRGALEYPTWTGW